MTTAAEIRAATKADAALICELNADVQSIHADAHPWRSRRPGPDAFTTADAERLLAGAPATTDRAGSESATTMDLA